MNKLTKDRPVSKPDRKRLSASQEYSLQPDSMALPPSDFMGVNNATVVASREALSNVAPPTGTRADDAPSCALSGLDKPLKTPDDYFYRLGVDTLQFSISGQWRTSEKASRLRSLREQAKLNELIGIGVAKFDAPDGTELQVFKHGARPCYDVLMRDANGLEIRALPSGSHTTPSFVFRFGARWCVENTIVELGEWALHFVREHGFLPERVTPSELHIRCDTPTKFLQRDVDRLRGNGTRNGQFNTYHVLRKLTGFDNLGGKKPFKFSIYNKRYEQREGLFWPAVWKDYQIPQDAIIWRVEGRWRREALRKFGIEKLSNLTEERLAGLWHWFTNSYLVFIQDPSKRTTRAGVTRKWKKVQACGTLMEVAPVVNKVDVTGTRLYKQAAGCMARLLATSGMGRIDSEVGQLLHDVMTVAEDRFSERRKAYIAQALSHFLAMDRARFAESEALREELRTVLKQVLSGRVVANPIGNLDAPLNDAQASVEGA